MINKFIKNIFEDKIFIKDSTVLFIANTLSVGFLFLINLALSQIFGPILFGSFKTTLYLFSLLPNLLDVGALYAFQKYIAEFRVKKKSRIGSMIVWFVKLRVALFSLLIIGLLLFRTEVTNIFLHDQRLLPLTLAGTVIVFCYFFVFLRSIVMGYENFTLLSTSLLASTIIYGVIGIPAAYFIGSSSVVVAYAISILLGSIICLPYILKQNTFKERGVFNAKKIFVGYSLPMFIINIPYQIGISITPILSIFFSQELIGYFSFAFMFYFAGSSIPSTIGAVLFPKVSRLIGQKNYSEMKNSLIRALSIYSVIVIAGIIGVLLFSKIFILLFAPKYLPGLTIFKAIIILGLTLGYFSIATAYFSAIAKLKETAILTLLQNIILFAVCYLLLATF